VSADFQTPREYSIKSLTGATSLQGNGLSVSLDALAFDDPLDGETVVGYVYDRRTGKSLADSYVRVLPQEGGQRRDIAYAEIAALAFTGRDPAAGKSWEAWVKKYEEKKAAGESNIGLQPDDDA